VKQGDRRWGGGLPTGRGQTQAFHKRLQPPHHPKGGGKPSPYIYVRAGQADSVARAGASPQGGGEPHRRERKRCMSGCSPHTTPRAGASPNTFQIRDHLALSSFASLRMTILNRLRLTRTSSYLKCIGGKPSPYYTRDWRADPSYSRGDPLRN